MKNKKHNKIVNDYDKIKSKHLDKLAKKMLDNDEKQHVKCWAGKEDGGYSLQIRYDI